MQWISVAGAAMVLTAYGAHQMGRLGREDWLYLLLNATGAAILTVFAFRAREAGLALMEGAWVVITLAAMARRLMAAGR
jgi:uncharacterized membrane protein